MLRVAPLVGARVSSPPIPGTMKGSQQMHLGVSMFHTDYSIPAVQLARALEERGFESMWAPEHSHIPVPRRTPFPGGGEVPKPYYEVMDPFVVLSAAAVVTKTLKLATGVCLVRTFRCAQDALSRRRRIAQALLRGDGP